MWLDTLYIPYYIHLGLNLGIEYDHMIYYHDMTTT